MIKAIGSRKNLIFNDYYLHVQDIIHSPIMGRLTEIKHHYGTTRLQHSINVSYYNYLICKKLGFDYIAAARAGLMHDLFFYQGSKSESEEEGHSSFHPKVAFSNASDHFPLSPREGDIILKHMWPLTISLPKYKESYVIVAVDKYCAILEVTAFLLRKTKKKVLLCWKRVFSSSFKAEN